jgi:hypothetical protein
MELQLDPTQPPEVIRAVGELLVSGDAKPDPWWQAGIDESLESQGADP